MTKKLDLPRFTSQTGNVSQTGFLLVVSSINVRLFVDTFTERTTSQEQW